MFCNSETGNTPAEQEKRAVYAMSSVPRKILVMSGKGGVGKTSVSVNLAYAFAKTGMSVGIIDADLHGPNVALMTGVEGKRAYGNEDVLEPVRAGQRVKVLSIASLLPSSDSPVSWRGPRKSAMIRQFIGQGDWRDVDMIIVDCPPGTGDEPMSVGQLIPDADGVIIVTSPQEVSLLDSRKCVNFVHEIDQKVLGIVENLSGFSCPDCGREINMFKVGGGEKAALEMSVPFLGRIPIALDMVEAGDSGKPLINESPDNPASKAIFEIVDKIRKQWEANKK